MRAWLIITLFAFVGTGLSIDSDCMTLDESTAALSQVEHQNFSVQEFNHQVAESASHRNPGSHSGGPCQHVHCSGIVLAKLELTIAVELTQENLVPKLVHIPSVNLKIPLKPPAA